MNGGNVAVVTYFVAAPGRKVNRTGNFFVEQYIPHRINYKGVNADSEFAYVSRTLVGVENSVGFRRIVGGRFDNFAVLKRKADVFELKPVLNGRRVVRDNAVNGIFNGRGIYFRAL